MDDRHYISSASANLTDVIVSLLESMDRRAVVPPNEVQAGARENGQACAAIVLVAIVIEGAVNRLRYFVDHERCAPPKNPGRGRDRGGVVNWLRGRLLADLHARCEEVFCVRDIIAHAHTWNATTSGAPTLRFMDQPRLYRYGDTRFRRVIDERTRRSRVLGLNAFATRIWRRDAYLTYQTIIDVITALEPLDPTGMNFSNWGYHSFDGKELLLPDLARALTIPNDA